MNNYKKIFENHGDSDMNLNYGYNLSKSVNIEQLD